MGVILITRKRIKGKDTAASDKATHLVARDVPLEPTVRKAGAPACLVSFIYARYFLTEIILSSNSLANSAVISFRLNVRLINTLFGQPWLDS